MKKAVFIDRDGTINEDESYFHKADKLKIIPGVIEGLKKLDSYLLVVVSNQSGIAKAIHTKQDTDAVNEKIKAVLGSAGIKIEKFYYCPHSEKGGCSCRKPATGMFEQAAEELSIDMNKSWMIGDKTADVKAAENVKKKHPGFRAIRVLTGEDDKKYMVMPDYVAKNMIEAANFIAKHAT